MYKVKKHNGLYVIFDKEDHSYILSDPESGKARRLTSVNEFIFSRIGAKKSKEKWNQYAFIGSVTHEQIERFLKGGEVENPTKFFETWKRFYHDRLESILRKYPFKVEDIVYSERFGLAGQIDLVVDRYILDWKTTWNVQSFIRKYKEAVNSEPSIELLKRNKLARYMVQISLYSFLFEDTYNVSSRGEALIMINTNSVAVFKNEKKWKLYAEKMLSSLQ